MAFAKICRQEQLSCLFQTVEASTKDYQALDLVQTRGSEVWQLNEKSHVSMQDSSFVEQGEFKKDKVERVFTFS